MEPQCDQGFSSIRKKTLQFCVNKPNVESVKALGQKMNKIQRIYFAKKYENILDLLEIDVQVEAITALAQYYDAPLRCFTFRDFQLASTLEEFEQILGWYLKDGPPYRYLGHYPAIQVIANVVKVPVRDLVNNKKSKCSVEGFSQKYLEEQAHFLAEVGRWDAFMDLLALIIYGAVLFPCSDQFVGMATIDVFIAASTRKENPVTANLADVYYTFTFCHERKKKRIICCLPMLYIWLTAHVCNRKLTDKSPFVDFYMLQLKPKIGQEWRQTLADHTEKSIRWYPPWEEIKEVICRCGSFPNVPLVGTRGCINYNPLLALRQLAYHMKEPPSDAALVPFVLYDLDKSPVEDLRRVQQAWDSVIRKSKDLGRRSCGVGENYRQWVLNRALKVKLHFLATVPMGEELPMMISEDDEDKEELQEVKAKLTQVEEDKQKLEVELRELRKAYETLQLESIEKNNFLENANKRARIEEKRRDNTKQCLDSVYTRLEGTKEQRDRVRGENHLLGVSLANAQEVHQEVLGQLESFKKEMEKTVTEYEERIKKEKQETEQMVIRYQALMKRKDEDIQNLLEQIKEKDGVIYNCKRDVVQYIARFANLVWVADAAIEGMPKLLKLAYAATHPLNTPQEVVNFMDHCKELVWCMKRMTNP